MMCHFISDGLSTDYIIVTIQTGESLRTDFNTAGGTVADRKLIIAPQYIEWNTPSITLTSLSKTQVAIDDQYSFVLSQQQNRISILHA